MSALQALACVALAHAAASCLGCGQANDHPPAADWGTLPTQPGDGSVGEGAAEMAEGKLQTQNSAGRTGAYYLPAGYNTAPAPLLVAYHGTGGSGADMVSTFRGYAATFRFLIVAPDSRRSPAGDLTWQVGDSPGAITEDYTHTLNCVGEVRAMHGIMVDADRVLAVGYSGGGSSAPYIGSNEAQFRAFAVLHGGVIQGGIGNNIIRGWFSTGAQDGLRPPAMVQQSADYMKGLSFTDITMEIYPGGHELSETEIKDVVAWWLGS